MLDAVHFRSNFLGEVLATNARTLRHFFQELSLESDDAKPSPAATLLLGHQWFIESQIDELEATLTREYCQKLNHAERPAAWRDPRIYRVISRTLGCVVSSTFGPQALGKLLTTAALAELFKPERLGEPLTLAELWAIPPVIKVVLLEIISHAVLRSPVDSTRCELEVLSAIECLHSLGGIRWSSLVESISVVHQILARDPSGAYLEMEFQSRDLYRHAVENIAADCDCDEEAVARLAVVLAEEALQASGDKRESHVGYYLVGPGVSRLRQRGELRPSLAVRLRELALRIPNLLYIGGTVALTAAWTAALYRLLSPLSPWWIPLLCLPVSQIAVWSINFIVNRTLPPRFLPRLDFSNGIPDEHRTFVVIPTLLLSRAGVERLLERLEVHYLANRDRNLVFALLTDFPDSAAPLTGDDPLLGYCARGIQRLNLRYAAENRAPFYLFHRLQRWNEGQGVWMGRERKRGKLEDFNRLLLGLGDSFEVKIGDLSVLPSIRYVITVDTDTQLPRDSAWKLAGTLAHPLQRPVVDPVSRTVKEGYAILQPGVSISMESAGRSRFAQIFTGRTGLDPYTTAISDVYQDLFGQASFTGKGIYDLRAVHAVLDGRFPRNTILSHDLIEGEYARVGLVADPDVIEDYPSTYQAYSRRKHRWVRGDWQLLYWLFPYVPQEDGRWLPNPLGPLSRWKIADNLRRSLLEISLLLMIVMSWLLDPAAAWCMTLAALGFLGVFAYAGLAASLLHLPPLRFWRSYIRERRAEMRRAHGEALLSLVFLPHQAYLMADAIVRTLARRFITRRNLLEWESMAQAETRGGNGGDWAGAHVLAGVILAALAAACLRIPAPWLPCALTTLWLASPWIARFVNAPPQKLVPEVSGEVEFLRDISLRTWRYFTDLSRPEDHWLVPDNIQEEPEVIARRSSPTNLGLQLASNVAAFDFGYLTHQELAGRIGDLLNTMRRMERHQGHFWNWYDTQTLNPLAPRYISTVDSGNLAAALIALKQACEGMKRQLLVDANLLKGMRDHCVRLREALPPSGKRTAAMRTMETLMRRIEARPANLFLWRDVLRETMSLVEELDRHVSEVRKQFENRDPERAEELYYWQSALKARAQASFEGICNLAPWVAGRYDRELLALAADSRFEDLIATLSHVPELGELPAAYDAIDSAIACILESSEALARETRHLLLRLREDTAAARIRERSLAHRFVRHAHTAWRFVCSMDFTLFVDSDRDQLHIGYNADRGCLDDCYYDLLASEARTAVFLAVAKGDAPRQAWFQLGRRLASFQGHRTLLSWGGTMFEYLMPALFMKTFTPSLLGESLSGVVRVQQAYARERDLPWGISESSCSSRNCDLDYNYRNFGIPAISLQRTAADNVVVAPYASMLALMIDRRMAAENLRHMASCGWTGRYGFFEAVDFPKRLAATRQTATVVRSFMAHHQGMGLLALCNTLLGNPMQNRFHAEPIVAATELLLQERVPALFASACE